MNKMQLNIIFAFLLAGLLVFAACVEPGNVENPNSGVITGNISLTNVPNPAPRVFISVWGSNGYDKWESDINEIKLTSPNYKNIPWEIPISQDKRFFASNGNFRLLIKYPSTYEEVEINGEKVTREKPNEYSIKLEAKTIFINNVNANVGDLGDINIKPITLSGTISVTYRGNPVSVLEIGVDSASEKWLGYTRLESPPAVNAPFSIELPPFTVPSNITFRVQGYNSSGVRLFNEPIAYDERPYNEDISGINLGTHNIIINPVNATQLVLNTWMNGEIKNEDDINWYSFNVNVGTKYYIWWNDENAGDNSKTLDIDVFAYDASLEIIQLTNGTVDENAKIINENDNAWNLPVYFTVNSPGTVNIRVRALNGAALTGTYAILYNTTGAPSFGPPTPLSSGVWKDGTITVNTPEKTIWYSFSVTKNTTYYIWWNEGGKAGEEIQGNGTKTLDVKVDAFYNFADKDTSIFAEVDSSWTTITGQSDPLNNRPISFKSQVTGTVLLRVRPFFENDEAQNTGTFAIVYSTGGARPNL